MPESSESPAAPLLRHFLAPMDKWLSDPATEEVCLNRPGEAWIRRHGVFMRHDVPLGLMQCEAIAILAGSLRRQNVGPEAPLLAAELPDGERLQACLFPVVPQGTCALTLRKPDSRVISPDEAAPRYDSAGMNRANDEQRSRDMAELLALYDAGEFIPFLVGCVHARLNIFLTGATGSGKTSLEKTLVAAIDPAERLITIEDTAELTVTQPNHLRLLFRRDDKAADVVDADTLLQACLRLRPDRVFVGELRGREAWTFAREVMTGHPGAISTIHGSDATTAFRQFFILCRGHPAAAGLDHHTLATLLSDVVDVIVPLREQRGAFDKRHVGHVWFCADAARRGETAADLLKE
jgi:type IV secretion system protein VirB11